MQPFETGFCNCDILPSVSTEESVEVGAAVGSVESVGGVVSVGDVGVGEAIVLRGKALSGIIWT